MRLPEEYSTLEDYTTDLVAFVNQPIFKNLSGGIHILDFFTLNVWGNLPPEWTTWFSTVDNATVRQDLIFGLDRPDRPQSLTIFLDKLRRLSLPRTMEPHTVPDLSRQTAVGMKPKKIHEVSYFASIVSSLGKEWDIYRAVDIGAGQGYLSRTLASQHNFDVLAVDGAKSQLEGAAQLTSNSLAASGRIRYLTHMIGPNTGTPDLRDLLGPPEKHAQGMVLALHACGSLTDDALRLFLSDDRIRGCAVIGCCYNHIRTRAEGSKDGFPLSTRLSALEVSLCGTARMLACQAPATWTPASSSDFFRRHFYRALFQLAAVEHGLVPSSMVGEITEPRSQPAAKMVIGGLPRSAYTSFPAYADAALRKLSFAPDALGGEAGAAAYEATYSAREGEIRIAWTLAAILAPVLESVILLDRFLYLKEQGITDVRVVPCFDYTISPRNMVIIAHKSD